MAEEFNLEEFNQFNEEIPQNIEQPQGLEITQHTDNPQLVEYEQEAEKPQETREQKQE